MCIKERKRTIKLLATSLLLTIFLLNNQAQPQQGAPPAGMQPQQQEATDIGEVSDDEITKFIDVFQELQSLQQETQMKAAQMIKESNLGMEKYREIATAQQNPSEGSTEDFSEEEMKEFNELSEKLNGFEQEIQTKSEEKIKEAGMEPSRYESIAQASQSDSALQERLQKELSSRQQQQQGAPQQGAPQQGAPQQGAPQQGAPQQGAPQQGAPQQQAPPPPSPKE